MHWRFLPGSYAEWVPLRSTQGAAADGDAPTSGMMPWRVTLRWVTDSENYNE